MTDNTQAQPANNPIILKPKSGLSMGQQVLIALILGVTAGLLLGEYTTGIKVIGDIYIGLLQMMLLNVCLICIQLISLVCLLTCH